MFSRWASKAALAGLLLAGIGVGGAAPASAGTANCNTGTACMWTANTYVGSPTGSFSVRTINVQSGMNSVANRGQASVARFFDSYGYKGSYFDLNNPARGGQIEDPNLSNGLNGIYVNWANRIRSASFI